MFASCLCVVLAVSASAQDTPIQGTGEAQPTAPPTTTAPQEARKAEAGGASEPESYDVVLARDFGVEIREVDPAGVETLIVEASEDLTQLREAAAGRVQQLEVRRQVADEIAAQTDSFSPEALAPLVPSLVQREVGIARSRAVLGTLTARAERQERLIKLLEQHRSALSDQRVVEQARRTEAQRESDEAEEDALAAVELARQRELEERDQTVKELLARERKLAEELLASTRQHSDELRELESTTDDEVRTFADAKAQLLAKIDEVPEEPTSTQRDEKVDPVFKDLVELRRKARTRLAESRRRLREAHARVGEAAVAVATAERALAEEQSRREQLETDVGNQRVAVAQAQLKLAQQRLKATGQIHDAMTRRVAEFESRVKFFNEVIPDLLPKVSSRRRNEFFSITSDTNWVDAAAAMDEGVRRIVDGALQRWHEVQDVSLRLVTWLGMFVVRLLAALVLLGVVLRLLPAQINRLSAAMFRRRFFRLRPRLTIKIAEVINSLARPVLTYVAIRWIVDFAAVTFPEARFVMWGVNAVFAYRIVVELVSVLALPRWYRREQGKTSATSLTELDESEASTMADVLGMELAQARKLVRSVKVVMTFWLLATYVPDAVHEVTGYTVIWWMVSRVAWVGLFGVVYWVLSTWKDDIARIFETVAGTRLPKAVAFVNRHKDRRYGVLVIALASIYVIVAEGIVFARRLASGTEIFKRLSTFAFRKKIELQAREREESAQPDSDGSELPPDYLAPFVLEPLVADSPFYVDRAGWESEIVELYQAWTTDGVQGSVALVGESGVGKTTLMYHLAGTLEAYAPQPICWRGVVQKHHSRKKVLAFLAQLFDLDELVETKQELIEAVSELESQLIMLDDCHHFFLREIGGFEGLETLLDIVNLTDHRHFWVLSFNIYAWSYVNRVSVREHYFGRVIDLGRWSDEEIQSLVERRTQATAYSASFTDLVISHEGETDGTNYYEVVKTARGYFRYLHEFSGGNPTLAIVFWLRSLRLAEGEANTLQVSLFRRPSTSHLDGISDNHWFVLAALAQHGELGAAEAAGIINAEEGFCHLAMNFFEEKGVVTMDAKTRRAKLTPLYFRYVLRRLGNSNFLYR